MGEEPPAGTGDSTRRVRRVRTPTVIQMEAVECGAASLAMVLGYYGLHVPLEQLRIKCGVSRDGSKASNLVKAARQYGFEASGWRKDIAELREIEPPYIVFWNFNHFVVVNGHGKGIWHLNDPASGPRTVTNEEFDDAYTGIVLLFKPGPEFRGGGRKPSLLAALRRRAAGLGVPLLFAVSAGLGIALLGLIIPTFTSVFVDKILIGALGHWRRPLLWSMAGTLPVLAFSTWLQQKALRRLEIKLSLTTSARFLLHVLRLPMEFFAQRFGGEVGARVALNDRIAQLLSGQLAANLIGAFMCVFFLFVMFQYDVVLTLVGMLLTALNVVALAWVSRRRKDINQRMLQEQGKLLGVSMNGLQIIETIKSTGGESDFYAQWAGYQAKAVGSDQELRVATQLLNSVPQLITPLSTMVILGLGGLRVMDGVLTMGELAAFQVLMTSFSLPVNNLVALATQFQQIEGDLNRLDDVIENPIEAGLEMSEQQEPAPADQNRLSGALELRSVTFGYNRLDPPLIEDFSLAMTPGSRVALVGSSGSGKSTVAKLVAGLYQPWTGEILFDGNRRNDIPRAVMTNSVAVVDQDILMYEATIRENLSLWDETASDPDLVRAAQDSCIHDVVTARAGGFDSVVQEGGRNFSGGQRQRLEIARSLHGNPSILVLDEATSALDPLTEKQIDDAIRRRGCTCLIIAHRLSTVRDADEIIVLERGKVVQRGTHEEMSQVAGPYARLIQEY